MLLETKAPGKIMIAGEYAVLCGYPAIAMPSMEEARCIFTPGTTIETVARGPQGSAPDLSLFDAVFRAAEAKSITPQTGQYCIDTRAFYDASSGHKLGLGSSAAATVALAKMILTQSRVDDHDALLNLAQTAHRYFSSGLGSGADVAVSAYAYPLRYQLGRPAEKLSGCEILANLTVIATKRPQDTRNFVHKALTLCEQEPAYFEEFCRASAAQTERLLTVQDEHEMIDIVDKLYHLLNELGERAHIAIVSPEHEAIYQLAKRFHGSAKPSGAGGGDIAIALVPKVHRDAFRNALRDVSLLEVRAK